MVGLDPSYQQGLRSPWSYKEKPRHGSKLGCSPCHPLLSCHADLRIELRSVARLGGKLFYLLGHLPCPRVTIARGR